MGELEHVEGPWLSLAALCEKVIEDKEGKLSLIGILDRITITASGGGAPDRMPPTNLQITAVVSLKSGFAKGKFAVGLRPVNPSGVQAPTLTMPILLEGDDRGANVILVVNAQVTEEGLYWFDVLLEQRVISRIPLRILYQRTSLGGPSKSA
jgi:hypothetical protein